MVTHYIRLTTEQPIVTKPRYHAREADKEIIKEVDTMIAEDIIERSDSPYSSGVVIVPKKDGEWRFWVDFREINIHTVADKYPLPYIKFFLHQIQDGTWFAAIDLRIGYWQFPVEEQLKKYTAFRCSRRLFKIKILPFGLTNAPSSF